MRALLDRIGQRALHALCILLVAVSAALLLRPLLLLLAAVADDDVSMAHALVALGYHLAIFGLAVTLHRRTRPGPL